MSRLIDADEFRDDIFRQSEFIKVDDFQVLPVVDVAECLDNAPTVMAIPIEFIKQLIEKFDCERGNAIKDTFPHILTGLLEFWEFEQEKENE